MPQSFKEDDRGAAERAILYGRSGTTAPSNASTSKSEASDNQQQTQIIKLLEQIRNRLTDMDRERTEIWDAINDQTKTLTEIEDRSSSTEKTFLSLEDRLSRAELKEAPIVERLDEIERSAKSFKGMSARVANDDGFQKEILDRIEQSDLQTARLIERIDEAMVMQTRITRRIDKVVQDKQRLNRKLSLLEESIDATRHALSSKALVLLTDKGMIAQSDAPRIPLFQDTRIDDNFLDDTNELKVASPENMAAKINSRNGTSNNIFLKTLGVSAFIVMAVTAGWYASRHIESPSIIDQSPIYQQQEVQNNTAYTPAEQQTNPIINKSSYMTADENNNNDLINYEALSNNDYSAAKDEEDLASALNAIEPSLPSEAEPERKDDALQDKAQALKVTELEKRAETKITNGTNPQPSAQVVTTEPSSPQIFKADEKLPSSLRNLEMEAFKGNPEAQHDLAVIYTAGKAGAPQNFERAAYWFEKAADQGIANARYNLGVLYHQGLGVNKDLKQAINWYQKAAQLGHAEAQYNLGIAYIEGIGVEYDPKRAADYFEAAAASGVPEAAFNLGLIYENGLTGPAQPDEAILWYKTASDLGNPDARNAMEALAKNLNISVKDIDGLVEKIRTPKQQDKQSQVSTTLPNGVPSQQEYAGPVDQKNLLAQIQDQLVEFGLYPGPSNGYKDPLTSDAIKLYQARNDIPVTGEPSEELLVHMLSKSIRESKPLELGSGD